MTEKMKKSAEKNSQAHQAGMLTHTDLELALDQDTSMCSPQTFAVCVRSLWQNWRQGTLGCKGRSDVSFSNKKPWKQKGTGRARAGSARSPLWRGGGVIHGPQPRTRTLKVNKETRKLVLRSMLHDYIQQARVRTIEWTPDQNSAKTSQAYAALSSVQGKRIAVFLDVRDVAAVTAFANLPNVQLMSFDAPNVYGLARCDTWVVLKKDVDLFKTVVRAWN